MSTLFSTIKSRTVSRFCLQVSPRDCALNVVISKYFDVRCLDKVQGIFVSEGEVAGR